MRTHNSDNDSDDWDEDWSDDDFNEDFDEDEPATCPECGKLIPSLTDKCPTCGYWLTAADRRHLRPSDSKPKWVVITATVVLVVLVLAALSLRF
jgi:hypothetical protein